MRTLNTNHAVAHLYTEDLYTLQQLADIYDTTKHMIKAVLVEEGIDTRGYGPHVSDLQDTIDTIANMRADGKTWRDVGLAVGREASTALRLFQRHQDLVRS